VTSSQCKSEGIKRQPLNMYCNKQQRFISWRLQCVQHVPKPTSQLQGSTVKIKKDKGTQNVRLIHGCSTWATLGTLQMSQQSTKPHIHDSMSQ
jgi:hypothetical protein